MDDPYAVGDPDQWMEDVARDAMRPIIPPEYEALDVPAFIRMDERVSKEQINGVLNLVSARGELPTGMEVINLNGCNVIKVEFGVDTRIITKSHEGGGYHIENPIDFELIGRKLINDQIS